MTEQKIEHDLISKLADLKYDYRSDNIDRDSLELNFRQKFEELNRVKIGSASCRERVLRLV